MTLGWAPSGPNARPTTASTWAQPGRGTGLLFTTRTGRPIEPRNFVRSFQRICDDNKVRLIKVHHVRHSVGSLLKDLGVPARDAQTILGHTVRGGFWAVAGNYTPGE